MKIACSSAVICMLLGCFTYHAESEDYYRQFLSIRGTNAGVGKWITAPSLVDSNNITFRFTNLVADLQHATEHGELAGIRFGMTMEEVVEAWGKPKGFYSWCFGGPRFFYHDASVIFDPATNGVIKVRLELFEHKPSDALSIEECIRTLGEPTTRNERQKESDCELVYSSRQGRLRLRIYAGRLFSVQAESVPDSPPTRNIR